VNGPLPCAEICPLGRTAGRDERPNAPPGYLRRIAAVEGDVDETKRNILKLAAVAGVLGVGGGAIGGALQYVLPPVVGIGSYPRTQLFDTDGGALTIDKVAGLATTSPPYQGRYNVTTTDDILFDYPLTNEPNFFLNLYPANGEAPSASNPGAANVPGGIGPNGSIVAYSAICQHLGCVAPSISYYPPGTCPKTFNGRPFYIHCSCHGSTYDTANAAANLTGPAVLPLPQVVLDTDADGNIYAVGSMGPPVNGHLNTLQGGYSVGLSSQLVKDTPTISCSFPS
jgi:Rieske Fe-S protein